MSTLSTILFLALGASVSALVVLEPTTGLFVPSWDVAIEPGQDDSDKIVVNGTIQQVDAYMEARYPGWSAKMANFTSSRLAPAKRAPDWRHPPEGPPEGHLRSEERPQSLLVPSLSPPPTDSFPFEKWPSSQARISGKALFWLMAPFSRSTPTWRPITRASPPNTPTSLRRTVYPVHAKETPASLPELMKSDTLRLKTLDGFSDIVVAAEAILSHCAISDDTLMPMVSGKTTLFGGYSFIVEKSSCGAKWRSTAIEPGQEDKIVVNGTIQQVDAYMEAHYPGWSAKSADFTYSHSAPAKARGDDFRFLKVKNEVVPLGGPAGVMGLHVGVNLLDRAIDHNLVFLAWPDGYVSRENEEVGGGLWDGNSGDLLAVCVTYLLS
ncbi:hypothetical protein E4U60_001584 [Claviceps pazoutovae]|uniref:Uncharacterized protein n=1 Tax=Claviceps pazoutovae TaxID=1649127 RepID=A0A9P7SHN5_9HYPO|nr:hypothetical protein E4U60_001584 [Claviceps pazoutovae]